jgi:hypothetical protein
LRTISFKFFRDRGDIFVDLAVEDGPWVQAIKLLAAIGEPVDASHLTDVDFIVDELCRNRNRVQVEMLELS